MCNLEAPEKAGETLAKEGDSAKPKPSSSNGSWRLTASTRTRDTSSDRAISTAISGNVAPPLRTKASRARGMFLFCFAPRRFVAAVAARPTEKASSGRLRPLSCARCRSFYGAMDAADNGRTAPEARTQQMPLLRVESHALCRHKRIRKCLLIVCSCCRQ